MKKIIVFAIIVFFMLSGCVEKNNNDTEAVQEDCTIVIGSDESSVTITQDEPDLPLYTPTAKIEEDSKEVIQEETDEKSNETSASDTKQELDELENLLEGLNGADFGDIEYSE